MKDHDCCHKTSPETSPETSASPESLRPLFIIVAYILGGVFLRAALSGNWNPHELMTTFMGGFFVVFSLFKMIDLPGFADGYATYDVIGKRSRAYALAYPFLELALGVLYLAAWQLPLVNAITVVLMSIGAVGVFQALREKRAIQCACLGTALKLPMTTVTLVEDLGMAAMAAVMLVI